MKQPQKRVQHAPRQQHPGHPMKLHSHGRKGLLAGMSLFPLPNSTNSSLTFSGHPPEPARLVCTPDTRRISCRRRQHQRPPCISPYMHLPQLSTRICRVGAVYYTTPHLMNPGRHRLLASCSLLVASYSTLSSKNIFWDDSRVRSWLTF